ncbi:hypothetical protein KOR42_50160 [Thalassoglobus neptunius]|uniref:Uncharacterized protein n=1 Tax=Thalassoglobus neptunius TaxID=1938619 RepID=A0A5C5VQW6_9PLAN|nr:hypothetical protein [Thalassoglobus neptunius]TWT40049.1 hypothetical protein KOR42_50160 [Thalassoglobus neptunius]
MKHYGLVGLTFVAFLSLNTENVFAQRVVVAPRRIGWGYYDPYYSVTNRVYAQATLIRAQGDAAVSYSTARNLNAEAYSKELDNWKKRVRTYWDSKILAERKRMEYEHVKQIKRLKYLNDRKWTNSRIWEQLKNHPELSNAQIKSGRALNFLLDRLTASALPYEFDPATSQFGSEALREVSLSDEWLSNITLKHESLTFKANESGKDSIELWPYLLRWDDFDEERQAYDAARLTVLDESKQAGEVSVENIRKLQDALLRLANEFHRNREVKAWGHENRRYSHFNLADRFLHNLDREILRLEATGDIRPFQGRGGYDPKTDGKHIVSLLTYMNRNGIEFAPAQAGSEWAYYDLFASMRAIYLTVAEQDESTQPKDLSTIE